MELGRRSVGIVRAVGVWLCGLLVVPLLSAAGMPADVADVSVEATAPDRVRAGAEVDYVLTVRNAGPADARDVVLVHTPDARSRFVRADRPCRFDGRTLTCSLGTLTPDQTRVVTVTTRTAESLADGTMLRSHASVTSTAYDDNLGNNAASSSVTVAGVVDLGLTLTGPLVFGPGEPATYTAVVDNAGGAVAPDVRLAIRPHPKLDVVTVPASCEIRPDPRIVACARDELASGERWTVRLPVVADPAAPPGSPVRTTALAWSVGPDADPSDNSAEANGRIGRARADLAVDASGPETMTPGQPYRYRIVVAHHGPAVARSTTVSVLLPAHLTVLAVPDECVVNGRRLRCELDRVAPKSLASLPIRVRPGPDLPAGSNPESTVTVESAAVDPDPSNDTASTVAAVPYARLVLSTTTDDQPPRLGGTVTFTVELRSAAGSGLASDLVVTDVLPAGTEPLPSAADRGTVREAGERTLTWRVGELRGGEAARLVLRARVRADAPVGRPLANQVWLSNGPATVVSVEGPSCPGDPDRVCVLTAPVADPSRSEPEPGPAPSPEPSGPSPTPGPAPAPTSTPVPSPTPGPAPTPEARLANQPAPNQPTSDGGPSVVLLGSTVVSMFVAARLLVRR